MIRILKYSEIQQEELTKPRGSHADVSGTVSEILETVRREGDAALLRYTERFDHVRLADLAVSREEYEEGLAGVDPAFLGVLREAAENIRILFSVRFSARLRRLACMCRTERQHTHPPC